MDCVFCRIIDRQVPAEIVYEGPDSIAFLDRSPVFPGHTLLVPREHIATFPEVPGRLLEPLFSRAQLLCLAIEKGLGADGAFVAINNRVSQRVPHLHLHIVPRRKGDGLRGFFWPRHKYSDPAEAAEICRRIASAMKELP